MKKKKQQQQSGEGNVYLAPEYAAVVTTALACQPKSSEARYHTSSSSLPSPLAIARAKAIVHIYFSLR
ncbi:hypothetical protein MRB53_005254 [Persea americana]|uniref:Uncharacterized protein n=1 Tax=Persea americana TaxID=3435 RepID=A0ACC2MDP7_PERAE|nr:hypothetical protein MRB53_005254 [Persea americana]